MLGLEPPETAIDRVPIFERASRVGRGHLADPGEQPPTDLPAFAVGKAIDRADQDPVQPGFEPIRVAQRAQVSPGDDERFLDRVLSEIPVREHELGEVVEPRHRGVGDDAERLAIATLCAFNQVPLHRVLTCGAGATTHKGMRRSISFHNRQQRNGRSQIRGVSSQRPLEAPPRASRRDLDRADRLSVDRRLGALRRCHRPSPPARPCDGRPARRGWRAGRPGSRPDRAPMLATATSDPRGP